MILDGYFARRFLLSFLMVLGVFLTLILLVDMIEQLRRFDGADLSFGQLGTLMLLSAPGAIKEILPLLMILSTILLFVSLARSSELVVTRALGRSGIRALAGPCLVALVIGALAVTMLNPIAAATSNRYQALSDTYRTGGPAALSLTGEGLWMRQGGAQGQAVIHATGYGGGEPVTLYGVTILQYAPDGGPAQRISAESARLEPGEWLLGKVKLWPLDTGKNPEAAAEVLDTMRLATTLTDDRIRESIGRPNGISIYDLPATIRALRQAGFATRKHEVWYMVELARPLFLLSMVLIGAAFTMRHTRFGGTGIAVLAAILLGFGLYFVRNFAQILGENGQIPVAFAAWAPPIAAILLGMGLLLHAEDG